MKLQITRRKPVRSATYQNRILRYINLATFQTFCVCGFNYMTLCSDFTPVGIFDGAARRVGGGVYKWQAAGRGKQRQRVPCTLVALPVCLRTANEVVEQDTIVLDVIRRWLRCTRREKLRALFLYQFLVMFSVVIYLLCFSGWNIVPASDLYRTFWVVVWFKG